MTDKASVDGFQFFDHLTEEEDQVSEILEGLTASSKYIRPKYFYDEVGSQLFEAITQLPEYYLTRAEVSILQDNRQAIADEVGEISTLIEFGSGSSDKVGLLLNTIEPNTYVPIDISRGYLLAAAEKLHRQHDSLRVVPICADYSKPLSLPRFIDPSQRLLFFPGSSIGNFTRLEAAEFLRNSRRLIERGGFLLIGFDSRKEAALLHAAYNDKQRVTERFNLNVLKNINSITGAHFDPERFNHIATYDEVTGCVRIFLQSRVSHTVDLRGEKIHFRRGERIHTEDSYKYSPKEVQELAKVSQMTCRKIWMDSEAMFMVALLSVDSL